MTVVRMCDSHQGGVKGIRKVCQLKERCNGHEGCNGFMGRCNNLQEV